MKLLDRDVMLLPDFHRFAIAENIEKRHASIRAVSKRPVTVKLVSVTLIDPANDTSIAGDTSELLTTRVPWAYKYHPYDDVSYRHYEDRVLIFRHTDDRLPGFGSPDELQLEITYRINEEKEVRTAQFLMEKVRYNDWAFP
ncbi:MAG: hypothetical protein AAF662_02710 [Pseudomonadota bacterium]